MRLIVSRFFEGWRFVVVAGGISSSLMLSVFMFRVFMGTDIPLLTHIDIRQEDMAYVGLACAIYSFIQQQALAARPALSIGTALADMFTSLIAFTVLVIFGWLRWWLRLGHLTEYELWTLVMLTFTTFSDGIYNSFISIRYLPRYIDVQPGVGHA